MPTVWEREREFDTIQRMNLVCSFVVDLSLSLFKTSVCVCVCVCVFERERETSVCIFCVNVSSALAELFLSPWVIET